MQRSETTVIPSRLCGAIPDVIAKLTANDFAEIPPGGEWSDLDFAQFTEATGLRIPVQLDWLLRTYGLIYPGDTPFTVTFDSGTQNETELGRLGGSQSDLAKDSLRYLDVKNTVTGDLFEPARAPEGYVHFGDAEGKRSRLLMDGIDPENNAVYLWGIAFDPWQTGDNTLGLGRVADSLFEWLEELSKYD